ncbi:MAG: TldD/PmbA family protein [Pseudobdellovibrionaceae bacterium]
MLKSNLDYLLSLNPKNGAEWIGLKTSREKTSWHVVRNEKLDHHSEAVDQGLRVEVLVNGHFGYSGTSDHSLEGLKNAFSIALQTTQLASAKKNFHFSQEQRPAGQGQYKTKNKQSFDSMSWLEVHDIFTSATAAMKISDLIVQRTALGAFVETDTHFVSSNGADIHQHFSSFSTDLKAVAQSANETQIRTQNGSMARSYQGGIAEALNKNQTAAAAKNIAQEALQLLTAPDCPDQTMDLILAPDQMLLQIHESIGHPLELDRILGDERNFAGWSFVKPEDFGRLQYGSALMNVTFDPTVETELASYAFDDCGHEAKKEFLIQGGVLKRGLGSLESQKRSGLAGVANFRSSSWNRAPIDRMANINLEPGTVPVENLISHVQDGILMRSNRSWSIDDYRRKFQFGCEYGQRIRQGKLAEVVKNPNYRGTTVPFWQALKGLSNRSEIFGSFYCGKGEPSQVIRVGHSSPYGLFSNVEIFGAHK